MVGGSLHLATAPRVYDPVRVKAVARCASHVERIRGCHLLIHTFSSCVLSRSLNVVGNRIPFSSAAVMILLIIDK